MKIIDGYPDYRVSDRGIIQSRKSGAWRDLKSWRLPDGRFMVTLVRDGIHVKRYVHHLVLEAFCGPCPPGMECRHLNDRREDNRYPENLMWGTHLENMADRVRNGYYQKGGCGSNAKLSDKQAMKIRRRYARGELQEALAAEFGISQAAISFVISGKTFGHLPLVPNSDRFRKLTAANVRAIRERTARGETQASIAADYGITQANVSRIVTRATWKHIKESP